VRVARSVTDPRVSSFTVVVRVVTGAGGGDGVAVGDSAVLVGADVAKGVIVASPVDAPVGNTTGVSVGKGVEVGPMAVIRLQAMSDGSRRTACRLRNSPSLRCGMFMPGLCAIRMEKESH